ncbi:MAG TPA: choice-of-anchor V domain-containing protein [Bacteroidia bacterium]|jgi:hypothetical protein|nr:choice-of-anchor V domain-containing protein [Bacteroidia bacterium]
MKKKIAIVSMTLLVGGSFYFTGIYTGKAHDTGAPAGVTGSPHDGLTCAASGCHNSNPLQNSQPWIISNVPIAGYTQDSIYTLTAKAVDIGYSSFGFEISPQTSGGYPLGTLIVTNSTATKIVTSGSFQYITHTINGYKGTDSLSWTFNWKAPAKGSGAVTFYGCFNCANGNSKATGTYVFPATLTVQESATDGIDNVTDAAISFSVFPNPAREQVNLTYNMGEAANVEVNMYSLDGRKLSALSAGMVNEGAHTQSLTIPSDINSGIYFIQLIANGQSTVKRIVVE